MCLNLTQTENSVVGLCMLHKPSMFLRLHSPMYTRYSQHLELRIYTNLHIDPAHSWTFFFNLDKKLHKQGICLGFNVMDIFFFLWHSSSIFFLDESEYEDCLQVVFTLKMEDTIWVTYYVYSSMFLHSLSTFFYY